MDALTLTSAIILALLILLMTLAVLDQKLKLPFLFELGMSFVILGFVGALEALINNSACTSDAVTLRWSLVGGGIFAMILSVALNLRPQSPPCLATDETQGDFRLLRHKSNSTREHP